MKINLVSALSAIFSSEVVSRLSIQFGISSEIVPRFVGSASMTLVVFLMGKSTTSDGASRIFSAIMSSRANARVGEQLLDLVATTAGLKRLEVSGHELACFDDPARFGTLSDALAARNGLPTQAAYALTGIVAAALFGTLKRHFLLNESLAETLPKLLGDQLRFVGIIVTDDIAAALEFGSAENFFACIPTQLLALSAELRQTGLKFSKPKSTLNNYSTNQKEVRNSTISNKLWFALPILVLAIAALLALGYQKGFLDIRIDGYLFKL